MPQTWATIPRSGRPGPAAAWTTGQVATVRAPSHSAVRARYRSTTGEGRRLPACADGWRGRCGGGVERPSGRNVAVTVLPWVPAARPWVPAALDPVARPGQPERRRAGRRLQEPAARSPATPPAR